MSKFKNYFNAISGNERIFSREDIADMTNEEYKNNEKAINYQLTNIGVPTNKELMSSENVVYVKAYTKDDGTHVKVHYRSKPDNTMTNNLSYIKNTIQNYIDNTKLLVQNKISDVKDKTIAKIKEDALKINADKNKNCPDAKELMDISILGLDNAQKNDKYTVIPSSKTKDINNSLRINNSMSLKVDNKW